MKQLKIKILHPGAVVPSYATDGSSGFDLVCCEKVTVFPGETMVIRTGLAMEIPPGYEVQIRGRSGLALKTPYIVKNGPGTIDSDYRGEVGVIVHNLSESTNIRYQQGDRIAQGVLCPVERAEISVVSGDLEETARGEGGYGSTGLGAVVAG